MGSAASVNASNDVSVSEAMVVQVRPSGYVLVLRHEGAHQAFVDFLIAEAWLPRLAKSQVSNRNFLAQTSLNLTNNQDNESLFDAVMEQPKPFLVVFPLFLSSPQYEKWVINMIDGDALSLNINASDLEICDSTKYPTSRSLDEAILSADWEELPFMRSRGGDWLKKFIYSVDTLPLSVTLSTARSTRPGYPLVYVNCGFLSMTGYTRSEIIGYSNNIHNKHSDVATVHLLNDALSLATPVKATIACARKDGSQYSSLIVMKPIFDSHGQYAYVVSVQCDCSASPQTLACAHALLFVLPNVLA